MRGVYERSVYEECIRGFDMTYRLLISVIGSVLGATPPAALSAVATSRCCPGRPWA
jgi:hypothetical protein